MALQSHLLLFHPLCFPSLMDLESHLMANPNTNPNTPDGTEKEVSTPVQASVLKTRGYGGEMMLSPPQLVFHVLTAPDT